MQMLRLGVLVFATASAFAADITGRWRAFVEGQDGNVAMYFSFRKDGEKITGTASGSMGELPIRDVRLNGDKVSFLVEAWNRSILHKGEISGIQMKLTVEVGERRVTMTAKRVAE